MTTSTNNTYQANTLIDVLQDSEKCASLFEKSCRELPCDLSGFFKKTGDITPCSFTVSSATLEPRDAEKTSQSFPQLFSQTKNQVLHATEAAEIVEGKKVAVLFSGGPAAGGHNVIVGLKKVLGDKNELWGIKAGPKGLLNGDLFLINDDDVNAITNLGGFDFLGSDRTKIKTDEQFEQVKNVVREHKLDGLVVIGGDDSNTNAAFLAEYLIDEGCHVIGVPKTIDGDLQADSLLPISFGFDTATKLYAELVGNILQDTPSSRKYWHFVKLMGRSASHVTLEVALKTHPHIVLISEEIAEKKLTLDEIVSHIASVVINRAEQGLFYGLVLIPEGLIEFIPELNELISHINEAIGRLGEGFNTADSESRKELIKIELPSHMTTLFFSLPESIQDNLLSDRDAHGNLKVSQIPTESLLVEMAQKRVAELSSVAFNPLTHFFGYEGRCGAPSRFDASFTYNLGLIAGSLILDGRTGYMASLTDLDSGGKPIAIPLTGLIISEMREGKASLVIEKALVTLDSPAFQYFESRRDIWAKEDCFSSPGPIQHWGPSATQLPLSVALNQKMSALSYEIA